MILSKYQGCGNDFILMDVAPSNPEHFARQVCDRHFGIGADGLMWVERSQTGDLKMVYLNSDGSPASMCGNGLRCFVRYVLDTQIISKTEFIVETRAGLIPIRYDAISQTVHLDLMHPRALSDSEALSPSPIEIHLDDRSVVLHTLHLGTLHAVVLVDDFNGLETLGPQLTHHVKFPQQINVNFVKIHSRTRIEVRTHERGAGWTLACGTGLSASAFIAHQLGLVESKVEVKTLGGICQVETLSQTVRLCGPAVKIADITLAGGAYAV